MQRYKRCEMSFTEGMECPICAGPIDRDNAACTPCGHVYHFPCLQQWLMRSGTCALCRSPIEPFFKDVLAIHSACLAPWEHGVRCTDYGPPDGTGNLLERCTAAYERFDAAWPPKHAASTALFYTGENCENCEVNVDAYASESVRNGRPAEGDGEDEEQSAEQDGEDDEQSAEGGGEDDEQPVEEDVELSLFDVLGYQYQPRVAITLTNPRLHYGVPIRGPGTAWLAPCRFSHVFNRNLTLLMNDDSRPHHQYIIRQSLTFRRVDTHDWILNHGPPPSEAFHTGMVYQPGAEEHTINTAALRMHMQPHMLESLLAEPWPQPILRIFNIQHGEAWLLHSLGASSGGSLTITTRHYPDYILRHNLVD